MVIQYCNYGRYCMCPMLPIAIIDDPGMLVSVTHMYMYHIWII